jgi:2-phosphosulfolactate phosphatase
MAARRKVEVYFLPAEIAGADVAGRTAVVVDLLRASTSIATALASGARYVLPVDSPERAFVLKRALGADATLLCGERKGVKIAGFDLGNSPREYTRSRVSEKRLVFASSNGSAAILKASGAARMCVAALVNAAVVSRWVQSHAEECVILCSGKLGKFAGEDAACAGHFVNDLERAGFEPANDAARMAAQAAAGIGDRWLEFVRATDHGSYLAELGFEADFPVVCARDSLGVLPVWEGDRLVNAEPVEG